MQETQVGPLGQEDPLEKEMATHSSILAWDREAWQSTVHGVKQVGHWVINTTHEYFRLLDELSTFYLTMSLKKFGMRG